MNSTSRLLSTARQMDPVQEGLLQEQCILVDRNDQVVGKASKRDCHLLDANKQSPLHRAFSLFIFNDKDELLLTQRSNEKITFPGMWTNTCCSHPLADVAGESEEADGAGAKRAAQRRVKDELGIAADDCPVEEMTFLTRFLYESPCGSEGVWGENEMDYIVFLRRNVSFDPNPNEVQATEYVKLADLKDFIKSVENRGGVTPWFSFISDDLLPKYWANLDNLQAFEGDKKLIMTPDSARTKEIENFKRSLM